MARQTIKYDEMQRIKENTFTKPGYTFTGWNTQADGQGESYSDKEQVLNLSDTQNGEITLYAQWSKNTYTVSFNSNGGTGSMQSQNYTYDVAQTLRPNAFTKSGYTFAGWTINQDGTGTVYTDEQSVSNLTTTNNGSVTLYAKWTPNNYQVVYNANGGEGEMSNTSCTFDTETQLATNNGNTQTELKEVTLVLLNENGEEMTKAQGILNQAAPGASQELNISITADYIHAAGYKLSEK